MSTGGEDSRREPGRVVEMFDDGRVIVNMGKDVGVNERTRLVVVRDYDELRDPEGGESLGRIMNPKVELSVYSVRDKYCVTYVMTSFADTLRGALPFLTPDRDKEPQVGDEVVLASDWGV